jgi:glyoxylase-like metal-dependent hydrolase (beta-lactamase superfamily II)
MTAQVSVISIGTMACNRLWDESQPVRTSHATTTLVVDGDRRILVDPSLPATALQARFFERTGQGLTWVTDVFCTTLRPVHRRSVEVFGHARWWASAREIQWYSHHVESLLGSAQRLEDEEAAQLRADGELIDRFSEAPESFTPQVGIYPAYGASEGTCGLIVTPPTQTIIVAGDAAITAEHYRTGQVWQGAQDHREALESLQEIMEIADIVIPGHDNLMVGVRNWL